MTPTQWEHVCALFEQAIALQGAQRMRFLEGLTAEPAWVHEELRSLLAEHGDDDTQAPLVDLNAAGLAEELATLAQGEETLPGRVGAFRVERELGRGGMGVVYLAHRDDGQFEQQVALKVVRRGVQRDGVRQRFLLERQVLAHLEHPAIARLLDGGITEDGRPYFAMEYVQGRSILAHCKAHDLGVNERLRLFIDVCDAVQYAHDRMVIHRDIKPSNILVDGQGRARLLDFGIAKLIDPDRAEQVTRTGVNLMTLQYASPEQLNGAALGVASDVYQLGLLLFEMLTERPPFDVSEMGLSEVIATICDKPVPSPSRYRSALGRDLDAIVLQALRKAPDHRYPSVRALGQDVQRCLDGQAVVARGQSPWYLLRRLVLRNRVLAGVTTVAAVALLGALVVSLALARDAHREAQRSQAAQEVLNAFLRRADPFAGADAEVSLADAVAAGRDLVDERVADDPDLAFSVYSELHQVQRNLGLYEHALDTARAAYEAAQAIRGDPALGLQAASLLASALVATGAPRDATALLGEELPPRPPSRKARGAWIAAELQRARAFEKLRDEEGLAASLQRVDEVMGARTLPDPASQVERRNLRGALARMRGDHATAEAERSAALALARSLGRTEAVAIQLNNLALDLGRQRRFEEAMPVMRESIAIIERISPNHPRLAHHRNNYGGMLYRAGRREEGVGVTRAALASIRQGSNRYWRYAAYRDMATYSLAAGEPSEGVVANQEQLALALEVFGEDSGAVAFGRVLLARYALLGGHYSFALALYDQVAAQHPVLYGVDMSLEISKIFIDQGDFEGAERAFSRRTRKDTPPAHELGLQLDCVAGDVAAVHARLASVAEAAPPARVPERRLAVRAAIVAAAVAGSDAQAWQLAAERYGTHAPYLSRLDRTRLLRPLVALLQDAGESELAERFAREWSELQSRQTQAHEAVAHAHADLITEFADAGRPALAGPEGAFGPPLAERACWRPAGR